MRSKKLYETTQAYAGPPQVADLYDDAFLQLYGRGDGTVSWDGAAGTIEWTNFPARRPDGAFLPDVTGVIQMENRERPVLFQMTGISLLPDATGHRLFGGSVRWYTDEPSLGMLNDQIGYEEGVIDSETGHLRTRAYVLYPDPPQS